MTITYDDPKTLKVLKTLSAYINIAISSPKKKIKQNATPHLQENEKPTTRQEFLDGMREALEEVKHIRAGKRKENNFKT